MPFNCLGDLYKSEVVTQLKRKGYPINSVHELNLVLEKMGILFHSGKDWVTTKEGVQYTIYNGQVFNADAWHPSTIVAVMKFLDSNY